MKFGAYVQASSIDPSIVIKKLLWFLFTFTCICHAASKLQLLSVISSPSLLVKSGQDLSNLPQIISAGSLTVCSTDEANTVKLEVLKDAKLRLVFTGDSFAVIINVSTAVIYKKNQSIKVEEVVIDIPADGTFLLFIPSKSNHSYPVVDPNQLVILQGIKDEKSFLGLDKSFPDYAILFGKTTVFPSKTTLLQRFLFDSNFPSWFNSINLISAVQALAQNTRDEVQKILLSRKMLFLHQSTWLLEDFMSQLPAQNDPALGEHGYKRYPYEMAAILGLVDWKTSVGWMEADGLRGNTTNHFSNEAPNIIWITKAITDTWDAMPVRAMSVHAIELLSVYQEICDFLPTLLGLIPSSQHAFMRVGDLDHFLVAAIKPDAVNAAVGTNKMFTAIIFNFYCDYSKEPLDHAPAALQLSEFALKELVLGKLDQSQYQSKVLHYMDMYSNFFLNNDISAFPVNDLSPLRIPLNPVKVIHLPMDKITKSYRSQKRVYKILEYTAILDMDVVLKDLSAIIPGPKGKICQKIQTILTRFDQKLVHKIKETNSINKFCHADDKHEWPHGTQLVEQLELLSDIVIACRGKCDDFYPWLLGSLLGLFGGWEDTIEIFIHSNSLQWTDTRYYVNWFSDRRHELLAKTYGKDDIDLVEGANYRQIYLLLYTLVQIYKEKSKIISDEGQLKKALKILLSIYATFYIHSDILLMRLFKLVPINTLLWIQWGGYGHAMVMRMLPKIDSSGERTFDLRIFNTGEGSLCHEVNPNYPNHFCSFAEFANVSLPFLILDSYEAKMSSNNATTISKSITGYTKTSWSVYPDAMYRVNYQSDDKNDEIKDLTRGQHLGTCAARSLMITLKSELGTATYQKLKIAIALKLMETYPESFYFKKYAVSKRILGTILEKLPERLENKVDRFLKHAVWDDVTAKNIRDQVHLVVSQIKSASSGMLQLVLQETIGDLDDYKTNVRGSLFDAILGNETKFTISLSQSGMLEWKVADLQDSLTVKATRGASEIDCGIVGLEAGDVVTTAYTRNGQKDTVTLKFTIEPFEQFIK